MLCNRCNREFEGEEWLTQTSKEVLCPDCYKDAKEE